MGDSPLYCCPFCCNTIFDSKETLLEHLVNISLNIGCPICNQKFSTVEQLTEHLKIDNCEVVTSVQNVYNDSMCIVVKVENDKNLNENSDPTHTLHVNELSTQKNNIKSNIVTDTIMVSNTDDGSDIGKMYVELLSKQMTKPCLQTQELKLVREDGENRYVILADEESLLNPGVTIVTKQNNDGTISLTTLKDSHTFLNKDSEMESEVIIDDPEDKLDKNDEEIYSCNTCGVSFSSVLEHIQNYHTDEDVVVHEPISEENTTDIPIKFESAVNREHVVEKPASQRMITESGNIIETPLLEDQTVADKNVYHKVVLKEVQMTSGNRVKLYNCITCNVYVTSLAQFKQQPCKVLKYQCPQCPVAYVNSKSLCAHMKVHKLRTPDMNCNITATKFECEICNTQFPTSKSLKLHKKMHDPIKSRPIEPPLETPEGTPASDDKYLCSICNKLIPIDYRTIHQNSHKSSNKMNCGICNKKFHSREYLDMHMSVHKLDKVTVEKQDKSLPYNCLYCNRKFARPHEKVKHERIHTGEKPHSCEICGKSFRVSYCLTLHMRTHTGARPYACPHCNKRFKAHSVYNHHLLTHSEVRAYKCPFCPKAFKTSVQLAGHKNSHTKPFSCQQCNRPFASLYAVRVHMEIHSRQNSLKFSCTLCGASYARAFALKDHMKQVHKQDIDSKDNLTLLVKDWMVQENPDIDSYEIRLNRELSQNQPCQVLYNDNKPATFLCNVQHHKSRHGQWIKYLKAPVQRIVNQCLVKTPEIYHNLINEIDMHSNELIIP